MEDRAIDQLAGTVLQHVQTAAIAADGDGRVGVFNPAAARVLSVDVADVLGRDLDELAAYARPLAAHVNLIPLNPTPGFLVRGSSPTRVAEFAEGLGDRGVTATVRITRGQEIDAACGQLAGRTKVELRAKGTQDADA